MKISLFLLILSASIFSSSFAQQKHINTFSSTDISTWAFGGNSSAVVSNGQLNATVVVSAFQTFEYTFGTINIAQNPVVKVRVSTSTPFTLRLDLGDNTGRYTNANPRSVTVAAGGFQEYTFDYTGRLGQSYPNSGQVDAGKINKITLFFNPGNSFSGNVQFDDLEIGVGGDAVLPIDNGIHINQVAYELNGKKRAVKEYSTTSGVGTAFNLINEGGEVVYTGTVKNTGAVVGWSGRYFWQLDFSDFQTEGTYRILLDAKVSNEFDIRENALFALTSSSVVDFFKGMRSTDTRDSNLPLNGGGGNVNVYGGWWDASGDPGKHMSHLSYANHFNPQQIPMVVWSLLKSYELATEEFTAKRSDLMSEAAWGADYLVRQLSPQGFFYIAIFDDWGNSTNRQVCEWGQPGQDNGRTANYQCAFREGGGLAIAALARAYTANLSGGEYSINTYLQKAETAYAHLLSPGNGYVTKNLEYCNNHQENIIDDYCALLAAVELYKATDNVGYLQDAIAFADRLMAKQQPEGWLASDAQGNRPFYHAADEGLPIVALLELNKHTDERTVQIRSFIQKQFQWYRTLSYEVNNPFDYTREYYKPYTTALETARKAFFLPHNNETGYWWQGENARLASLSTALILGAKALDYTFTIGEDSISTLALSHLDWIMGKNPFDVCMMYGFGQKNYPHYLNGSKKMNVVGGICNGITAMNSNENNLVWAPYDNNAPDGWQNWRWIEQWLPHDAWYLIAVSSISYTAKPTDCHGDRGGTAYLDACGKCVGGNTGASACIITGNQMNTENNKMAIYPNPVHETLYLDFVDGSHEWKLFTIYGQAISSGHSSLVDVSNFSAGTYLLAYKGTVFTFVKH